MNGIHFCEFRHRLPLAKALYFNISGHVRVHSVSLEGDMPTAPPLSGINYENNTQKQKSIFGREALKEKFSILLKAMTTTSTQPSFQPIQPLQSSMHSYPSQPPPYQSYPNIQPMQQQFIRSGKKLY